MRYFNDRSEAGKILAQKLTEYKAKSCSVVCLSEGGVLVGYEIAKCLHASLFKLNLENVLLPGEPKPVGTLSSEGTFTYNSEYSKVELEGINMDYHSLIEQNRYDAFQKLNRGSQKQGHIPKKMLKGHVVIFVSDGLKGPLELDVAADFIKPVEVDRLLVAVPIASVPAVDRMHLLADEIHCLGVIEDYMNTDHYYEKNDLPRHQEIIEMMEKVVLKWDNSTQQPEPKKD
jgi:putative phosphoribosyl transferase